MKKALNIVLLFVGIIGIFLLLGFLFLFGSMMPRLYWPVTLLAGIVMFVYGLVHLANNKNTINFTLLLLFNITGTIVLLSLYFFTFILQTGFGWSALTWGLPLIIGTVLLCADTVYMIRKNDLRRGLRGFTIGWGAYIYIGLMLFFGASLMAVFPTYGPHETVEREENKVLEMVLKELYGHRIGYALVEPEISIGGLNNYQEGLANTKEMLLHELSRFIKDGRLSIKYDDAFVDIDESTIYDLVDKFVEVNRLPGTIGVKSSPLDGYYIEYKKESEYSYLNNIVRPMISPYVDLSLPAYDKNSGLIITYIGEQYGPLMGQGRIFLLKYENGKIITLFTFGIWVS
jgi:hypothetical protein